MAAPTRSDLTTSTSDDFSHNLSAGSDRIVLVKVSYEDTTTSLSPTYGGQAMTEVTGSPSEHATGNEVVHTFYLLEADLPADGANTVSVGGSLFGAHYAALTYSGAEQAEPDGYTETSVSDAGTISDDVTTAADDSVILSFSMSAVGNRSWSAHGSGQTELWDESSSGIENATTGTEEVLATAGTDTQSHTFGSGASGDQTMASLAIAPASTGPESAGYGVTHVVGV